MVKRSCWINGGNGRESYDHMSEMDKLVEMDLIFLNREDSGGPEMTDKERLDRLEALPGLIEMYYHPTLANTPAPSLRSEIDLFLARLDDKKP